MVFRVPGPCAIEWGGADLGKTKAGIIVRTTPNWVPIIDDEHGAEPADYIWMGKTITVECIGLHESDITFANLFTNTLGANKLVGETTPQNSGSMKVLEITEREGYTWRALNAEPLPPELSLGASQELPIPLIFMVMFDESNKLFSTLPTYLGG